jgi:salicylate hydroxylase
MALLDPGRILIAGGGIGGLALAVALARTGRESLVLEAREEFGTAGAGIQIGPNGVRVLDALGVARGLLSKVGKPESKHV